MYSCIVKVERSCRVNSKYRASREICAMLPFTLVQYLTRQPPPGLRGVTMLRHQKKMLSLKLMAIKFKVAKTN